MHSFKDFKNFASAELNLFAPVTVVIGKNGSGKTNLIEAVELLANLAHGRPLYEVADVGRGAGIFEVRGGLVGCARIGVNSFTLTFSGSVRYSGEPQPFEYSLTIEVRPEPRVFRETLAIADRVIFLAELLSHARSSLLRVTYDNFARGGNKPSQQLSAVRSVLSRYVAMVEGAETLKPERYADSKHAVNAIMGYLKSSFVFDPSPRAMRAYERVGQDVLVRDGANLSSVLHSLQNGNEKQKAALARLLAVIKQLPEEPYADFGFVVTSQGDVLFGMNIEAQAGLMDARVLSDGTLRSLAVLTALETVPEGSRVVVEEFDNGVHPTRVGLIATALWECGKRRRLNVFVTTHNPATLDSFTKEQLQSVVLCVIDQKARDAKLLRLMALPDVDLLFEAGTLGDLVTRRILEKHLMPDFSQEKREIASKWLEGLK
jgi:ABC-type cobalamin/Fe3+-siderophores transport system ATPase subunit